MAITLIQFAPIFHLVGAKLNLISQSFDVEIAEYAVGKKTIIERAVKDIDHYLDVKTDEDVCLFFGLVDFIDGDPNPFSDETRNNIINLSPLTVNGKFILQELSQLKTNKSWHLSETANDCTYFGEQCTGRGSTALEGKRGRPTHRSPQDYHKLKSNGQIDREQLTTRAVEALWRAIPKEVMVSATKPKAPVSVEDLKKLSPEKLEELIALIREVEGANI